MFVVALTSFSSSTVETSGEVCNAAISQTYYHNGSNVLPAIGDNVYSNTSGTTSLSSGFYKISSLSNIRVNSSGVVTEIGICST